jgi:hypothetical protein
VLIRAWIAEGCPAGTAVLGMFEKWSRMMGGILDVAGIPGFLQNRLETYTEADAEGVAWRTFVESWWAAYSGKLVSVAALLPCAGELDLGDGHERSRRIRLGKRLASMRNRRFSGLVILDAGTRQGSRMWQLLQVGGSGGSGGCSSHPSAEPVEQSQGKEGVGNTPPTPTTSTQEEIEIEL